MTARWDTAPLVPAADSLKQLAPAQREAAVTQYLEVARDHR